MNTRPYNPLDKVNLAKSIELEVLTRQPVPFSEVAEARGAGVYVIYYFGDFQPYASIAASNSGGVFKQPIYIGKAIPKGGRKGGISADSSAGRALSDRLGQHQSSIEQAENLRIEDFVVRFLTVDDIWIPLGENMLIETFKPLWNRAIDGFGNKDPGRRRSNQYKSPWDVLHPGRKFAEKLADSGVSPENLVQRTTDYLAGRPMAKLPKKLVEQIETQEADAEDSADEA